MADILYGGFQLRNTILSYLFYRLKLVESYRTGIQRIFESYQNMGQPQFLPETSSFVTILPNTRVGDNAGNPRDKESPESRVLNLFSTKSEISRKDVETLLGCSSFPARKILNSLLSQKKISVIGNARNTRYILGEQIDKG